MTDNLKDEVGNLLKESQADKKLPEAPEKAAMKKQPKKPEDYTDGDTAEDVEGNDLDVSLDTAKMLKQKEIEIQRMEKRVDDKLKKVNQLIELTRVSGRSLAGMPTEKTPQQARSERLKNRFKGTGIDTYIQ